MITLKPISSSNFETCMGLKVSPAQKKYIASNAYSLAEAYVLTQERYETPLPYGIYHQDKMIGFALAIYQPRNPEDERDDKAIYFIPRFMIDEKKQGKGYGREAFKVLMDHLSTQPVGKATELILSVDLSNKAALSLYEAAGFKPLPDEVDDDGDQIYAYTIQQ